MLSTSQECDERTVKHVVDVSVFQHQEQIDQVVKVIPPQPDGVDSGRDREFGANPPSRGQHFRIAVRSALPSPHTRCLLIWRRTHTVEWRVEQKVDLLVSRSLEVIVEVKSSDDHLKFLSFQANTE